MVIRSYRNLTVWQMGKQLVLETYLVTRNFPNDEKFGLSAQMRRAAVSVPSNIAEGFSRLHGKEYRNFLFISLSSCSELDTQLEIAGDLGYVGHAQREKLAGMIGYESKMLRNLIKKVQQRIPN